MRRTSSDTSAEPGEGVFPEAPVALVDDEVGILDSYEITLRAEGISNIVKISDSREFLPYIEANDVSVLVLDLNMPHLSGMELLTRLQSTAPDIAVVVCTAHGDLDTAVRSMRLGAQDYLVKPVEPSRFVAAVRNQVESWELRQENERLRDQLLHVGQATSPAFAGIVTADARMLAVFRYVEVVAPTTRPVLITGETGVGKELLARAVHAASGRKGKFVAANIAEFDDSLLSDTLFGHVRGAFTGADRDRPGLIEQAHGGTLFLDEIGDMQTASQVKLLRLLQEREYFPVGADRPRRTDARIVLATHRDLHQMVREGTFRKDLYYRVSAHQVEVPPLRERPGDLPLLLQHFVAQGCEELGRPMLRIPPETVGLINGCPFPGNVRELQGLVFEAVTTSRRGALNLEPLRKYARRSLRSHGRGAPSPATMGSRAQLPRLTLAEAEEQLIEQALQEANGNQTYAASLLGISRNALIRRLKKRDEGAGANPEKRRP